LSLVLLLDFCTDSVLRFPQTVETIIPLLEALSKDVEPVVKQHLVEQIKNLAKVLSSYCYLLSLVLFPQFCCTVGEEAGYKVMLDKLLPLTARLLEDDKQEVILLYVSVLKIMFYFAGSSVRQFHLGRGCSVC
jgi:hypothetical protein